MNNSREKFEAWNMPKPESFYEDKNNYDLMFEAWQAASEQSQKEIAELQAREKVLVEALQNLVEDISKTHGNYTYEQEWLNAAKALANVRGEVK